MATHHPSRCVREGEPILTVNFFLCAGMCRKLTFGNYLNYVAMCPARVGHGPDAPNEWRTRVVRVGGARGGPCGQVHIARRPPWRRLRLTVWATAGRSNQIARNGPKRAAGALRELATALTHPTSGAHASCALGAREGVRVGRSISRDGPPGAGYGSRVGDRGT